MRLAALPVGYLQPEVATDDAGRLHLLSFAGDPAAGDLYHALVPWEDAGDTLPVGRAQRVNSRPGTAIAVGTVRGGHLALGGGRAHVAWMSADRHDPGMYYARSTAAGDFEAQRNVSRSHTALDGGGSVAADAHGHVWVAWHAGQEETTRQVWVAASTDTGVTFATETLASPAPEGACGCCGMRAGADARGDVFMLFRSARERVHRDMQLLRSVDGGATFTQQNLQGGEIAGCPMSTAAIQPLDVGALLAWETQGQVWWVRAGVADTPPRAVPGQTGRRKHPSITADVDGRVTVVWTEGTGWNHGGDLARQVFAADGAPMTSGRLEGGVPIWSRPAVVARPGGGFLVVH